MLKNQFIIFTINGLLLLFFYPAGGSGAGRGDRHPQVPVGVSLLDYVVGDSATAIIQRRVPGNDHVVPVDLIKDNGALWWLRTVCIQKVQ